MTDDKRRRTRFDAEEIFAAISVVGGSDQSLGVISNVSEGGVCVRTPIPPPMFGKVVLKISIDERHLEVRGMVRRVEDVGGSMYDVGIQFAPMDRGKTAFLSQFLDRTKR